MEDTTVSLGDTIAIMKHRIIKNEYEGSSDYRVKKSDTLDNFFKDLLGFNISDPATHNFVRNVHTFYKEKGWITTSQKLALDPIWRRAQLNG